MSTTPINDGGPAFPRSGYDVPERSSAADTTPQDGMSLRDWFAGQTLVGTLAGMSEEDRKFLNNTKGSDEGLIARACYRIADAMLAARKEPIKP